MLKFTRRVGETFFIGDGITITVIKIEGKKTTLGISAPSDVKVMRSELIQIATTSPDRK